MTTLANRGFFSNHKNGAKDMKVDEHARLNNRMRHLG
jgi:hypothetical protein